ncbi:ABC transporter permease [Pseudodesulfovibrio sp. zrk46]|uniref:ABC transporter permease n=1 Tax=Pseudodesulfovibrio sp. zrk46 TaxID=2725288 RepID=UPI001448E49E|nr:ABC transporter permease [Pseudodesulfovibrio sp. zrk46]QJB56830.1 ABC transporter permease [Pseudodesulfovibrio sp. zrk46]
MPNFRLNDDLRNRLYILGMVSALLVIWEVATRTKFINTFYASQPTVIASDFYHFVTSGDILPHLLTTLQEALFGLFFGTIAGIICGVALGKTKRLADLFEPIITALYGIPKLALAPIFILWFGLGMESKIFLSALLVFYLVFFSTYSGIRNINPDIIATVQLMGANRHQIFFKVTLPSCVPWVLTGIRGGIGASLIGAIVGEYMGASAGLGWMIQYATTTYQIERVMSCILALLLIGLVLNKGLRMCEKRLLRWRPDNF